VPPLPDMELLHVLKHVLQDRTPFRSEGPATAVQQGLTLLEGRRLAHFVSLEHMHLPAK
jgi:hypothetical protein